MNKELIERMKTNRVPNYLLEDDEYGCLEDVGENNREYHGQNWVKDYGRMTRNSNLVHRIVADYQPPVEDELEKVEIELVQDVHRFKRYDVDWYAINAPALKGFAGYLHADGRIRMSYCVNLDKDTGLECDIMFAVQLKYTKISHATHVLFRRQG